MGINERKGREAGVCIFLINQMLAGKVVIDMGEQYRKLSLVRRILVWFRIIPNPPKEAQRVQRLIPINLNTRTSDGLGNIFIMQKGIPTPFDIYDEVEAPTISLGD